MTKHKKSRFKLRSLYNWHRYLGISASLFVIILSVTGLLLNHTEQLQLQNKKINNAWMLNWYNITTPAVIPSHTVDKRWISQWDENLFLDAIPLGNHQGKLIGAVKLNSFIIIGLEKQLLIYTNDGQLVEALTVPQGVPADMARVGTSSGQLTINTVKGNFIADDDIINWAPLSVQNTRWSNPDSLPPELFASLAPIYRGQGLSTERVLLDLHSGRIFGAWGIYLMDIASILLLFLAVSGLWIWFTRIKKQKQHQRTH